MSKQDMRMNIRIDGDNKGFKRSLKESSREMDNFQKGAQQGGMSGGSLAALGLLQAANGGVAAMLRRPKLRDQDLQAKYAHRQSRMSLADAAHAGNIANYRRAKDHHDNVRGIRGRTNANFQANNVPINNLKQMFNPAVIAGIGGALVAGGVIAAAVKGMNNQQQFNMQAKQFSGSVMSHDAQVEVRGIRKKIAQANNPDFIAQQKSRTNSKYMVSQAGVSEGSDAFTQAGIVADHLWAALIEAVSAPFTGRSATQAAFHMAAAKGEQQ